MCYYVKLLLYGCRKRRRDKFKICKTWRIMPINITVYKKTFCNKKFLQAFDNLKMIL